MELFYICGIDIGILHLGVSFIEVKYNIHIDNYELSVVEIELVDITKYTHNKVCKDECKLFHTNSVCDRVNHFIQEYKEKINACKYIFIERQPITGITSVEQLLYNEFRSKSHLVSPNNIHKYFGLDKDVNKRKEKSIKIGMSILYPELLNKLYFYERKHDITDSILIAYTGFNNLIKKQKEEKEEKEEKKEKEKKNINLKEFFEKYKYIKKV